VIVDFKDSQLFIKILEQYIYDCVHKLKQKNIIIYTAFKLGRPTILKLIKNIKGYLKSEINYKVIVDKNLIGGVVIKGDNFNINKSVDNVVNAMFNEGVIGGENV
jgi:F0F1-type ATP synthase delta subunit